jgi:hypothetical protein
MGSMNDGRFFTDYTPSCVQNSKFAKAHDVQTANSNAYRQALQQSGMSYYQQQPVCGPLACKDHGVAVSSAPTSVSQPYVEADGADDE